MALFKSKGKTNPPSVRPPAGDPNVPTDDVGRLLFSACANELPALIVSHDLETVCRAQFQGLSRDSVSLDAVVDQPKPRVRTASLCSVSFHQGNRARVFLARVRSFHMPRIQLWRPEQIAEGDARIVYRVPVVDQGRIRVELLADDWKTYTPKVLDVSPCGICLELPEDAQGEIAVDSQVTLNIEHDGDKVKLFGVVRRRSERRYGIFFPQALQGDQIHPPEALRKIVLDLERAWLYIRR